MFNYSKGFDRKLIEFVFPHISTLKAEPWPDSLLENNHRWLTKKEEFQKELLEKINNKGLPENISDLMAELPVISQKVEARIKSEDITFLALIKEQFELLTKAYGSNKEKMETEAQKVFGPNGDILESITVDVISKEVNAQAITKLIGNKFNDEASKDFLNTLFEGYGEKSKTEYKVNNYYKDVLALFIEKEKNEEKKGVLSDLEKICINAMTIPQKKVFEGGHLSKLFGGKRTHQIITDLLKNYLSVEDFSSIKPNTKELRLAAFQKLYGCFSAECGVSGQQTSLIRTDYPKDEKAIIDCISSLILVEPYTSNEKIADIISKMVNKQKYIQLFLDKVIKRFDETEKINISIFGSIRDIRKHIDDLNFDMSRITNVHFKDISNPDDVTPEERRENAATYYLALKNGNIVWQHNNGGNATRFNGSKTYYSPQGLNGHKVPIPLRHMQESLEAVVDGAYKIGENPKDLLEKFKSHEVINSDIAATFIHGILNYDFEIDAENKKLFEIVNPENIVFSEVPEFDRDILIINKNREGKKEAELKEHHDAQNSEFDHNGEGHWSITAVSLISNPDLEKKIEILNKKFGKNVKDLVKELEKMKQANADRTKIEEEIKKTFAGKKFETSSKEKNSYSGEYTFEEIWRYLMLMHNYTINYEVYKKARENGNDALKQAINFFESKAVDYDDLHARKEIRESWKKIVESIAGLKQGIPKGVSVARYFVNNGGLVLVATNLEDLTAFCCARLDEEIGFDINLIEKNRKNMLMVQHVVENPENKPGGIFALYNNAGIGVPAVCERVDTANPYAQALVDFNIGSDRHHNRMAPTKNLELLASLAEQGRVVAPEGHVSLKVLSQAMPPVISPVFEFLDHSIAFTALKNGLRIQVVYNEGQRIHAAKTKNEKELKEADFYAEASELGGCYKREIEEREINPVLFPRLKEKEKSARDVSAINTDMGFRQLRTLEIAKEDFFSRKDSKLNVTAETIEINSNLDYKSFFHILSKTAIMISLENEYVIRDIENYNNNPNSEYQLKSTALRIKMDAVERLLKGIEEKNAKEKLVGFKLVIKVPSFADVDIVRKYLLSAGYLSHINNNNEDHSKRYIENTNLFIIPSNQAKVLDIRKGEFYINEAVRKELVEKYPLDSDNNVMKMRAGDSAEAQAKEMGERKEALWNLLYKMSLKGDKNSKKLFSAVKRISKLANMDSEELKAEHKQEKDAKDLLLMLKGDKLNTIKRIFRILNGLQAKFGLQLNTAKLEYEYIEVPDKFRDEPGMKDILEKAEERMKISDNNETLQDAMLSVLVEINKKKEWKKELNAWHYKTTDGNELKHKPNARIININAIDSKRGRAIGRGVAIEELIDVMALTEGWERAEIDANKISGTYKKHIRDQILELVNFYNNKITGGYIDDIFEVSEIDNHLQVALDLLETIKNKKDMIFEDRKQYEDLAQNNGLFEYAPIRGDDIPTLFSSTTTQRRLDTELKGIEHVWITKDTRLEEEMNPYALFKHFELWEKNKGKPGPIITIETIPTGRVDENNNANRIFHQTVQTVTTTDSFTTIPQKYLENFDPEAKVLKTTGQVFVALAPLRTLIKRASNLNLDPVKHQFNFMNDIELRSVDHDPNKAVVSYPEGVLASWLTAKVYPGKTSAVLVADMKKCHEEMFEKVPGIDINGNSILKEISENKKEVLRPYLYSVITVLQTTLLSNIEEKPIYIESNNYAVTNRGQTSYMTNQWLKNAKSDNPKDNLFHPVFFFGKASKDFRNNGGVKYDFIQYNKDLNSFQEQEIADTKLDLSGMPLPYGVVEKDKEQKIHLIDGLGKFNVRSILIRGETSATRVNFKNIIRDIEKSIISVDDLMDNKKYGNYYLAGFSFIRDKDGMPRVTLVLDKDTVGDEIAVDKSHLSNEAKSDAHYIKECAEKVRKNEMTMRDFIKDLYEKRNKGAASWKEAITYINDYRTSIFRDAEIAKTLNYLAIVEREEQSAFFKWLIEFGIINEFTVISALQSDFENFVDNNNAQDFLITEDIQEKLLSYFADSKNLFHVTEDFLKQLKVYVTQVMVQGAISENSLKMEVQNYRIASLKEKREFVHPHVSLMVKLLGTVKNIENIAGSARPQIIVLAKELIKDWYEKSDSQSAADVQGKLREDVIVEMPFYSEIRHLSIEGRSEEVENLISYYIEVIGNTKIEPIIRFAAVKKVRQIQFNHEKINKFIEDKINSASDEVKAVFNVVDLSRNKGVRKKYIEKLTIDTFTRAYKWLSRTGLAAQTAVVVSPWLFQNLIPVNEKFIVSGAGLALMGFSALGSLLRINKLNVVQGLSSWAANMGLQPVNKKSSSELMAIARPTPIVNSLVIQRRNSIVQVNMTADLRAAVKFFEKNPREKVTTQKQGDDSEKVVISKVTAENEKIDAQVYRDLAKELIKALNIGTDHVVSSEIVTYGKYKFEEGSRATTMEVKRVPVVEEGKDLDLTSLMKYRRALTRQGIISASKIKEITEFAKAVDKYTAADNIFENSELFVLHDVLAMIFGYSENIYDNLKISLSEKNNKFDLKIDSPSVPAWSKLVGENNLFGQAVAAFIERMKYAIAHAPEPKKKALIKIMKRFRDNVNVKNILSKIFDYEVLQGLVHTEDVLMRKSQFEGYLEAMQKALKAELNDKAISSLKAPSTESDSAKVKGS